MSGFWSTELRSALRGLLAQPWWTLAALLCLAIGTGVNTAGLSVINALLLRPLPFENDDELAIVSIQETEPPRNRLATWDEYREIASQATMFRELAGRAFMPVSVAADDPARMIEGEVVSENYFATLSVAPMRGRFFSPGAENEIVLSERVWKQRFNSDPAMPGRSVLVNGRSAVVVGIAPPGFTGATQLIAADLWMTPALIAQAPGADGLHFWPTGRLRPEATREQARQQLDAILAGMAEARGQKSPPVSIVDPASGFGFAQNVVWAGSGFVFILGSMVMGVAVANVAGLMLARAPGRRREISVRLALGAKPARIAAMVLTESLLLGLLGSGLGVLLSVGLLKALPTLASGLPEYISYTVDVHVDWRVAGYAAIAGVIVSVFFGLAPALQAARTGFAEALKQTGTNRRTPASTRALNALVAGQMAIATTLLAACGLLAKTYVNTLSAEPGFDTSSTIAAAIDLDQIGYDAARGLPLYDRLLERASALPGVQSATLSREVPLWPVNPPPAIAVRAGSISSSAQTKVVSPGHFDALRIPLLRGRDFSNLDGGAASVAVINETMARALWPGASPLGEFFEAGNPAQRIQVIGVAQDIKYRSLTEQAQAVYYRPLRQQYAPRVALLLRASQPLLLADPIRRIVQEENPALAVLDIRTFDQVLDQAIAPRRRAAGILGAICLAGLLLSSFGLYGVVAFGVRERAREFGLRMALGARPNDVAGMVVWRGLRVALTGFTIGAAASFGTSRLLGTVIVGVGAQDVVTLAIAGGVLTAVAAAASFVPARWATKVDPAIALRD